MRLAKTRKLLDIAVEAEERLNGAGGVVMSKAISGADFAVIGLGPVGLSVCRRLSQDGCSVRAVQRSAPSILPEGVAFVSADATDPAALAAAMAGVHTVALAIGLPYKGALWMERWPQIMSAVLAACESVGARLVYADSLYLYGPQDQPLTENLPAVDYGMKPAARSAATRLWQRAQAEGRVRTAAVRAPDFFGPGVSTSILGDVTFGRLAKGKPAQVLISADYPHNVVHVDDFARAIDTLMSAPDDAFGQAWHVPTPPTKTLREMITLATDALGVAPKVSVIPLWQARLLGAFSPEVREVTEMHFLTDRPYIVDSQKFAARFWSNVSALEVSIAKTARTYARP
jgi:nucleoside-diphosphate-sugar epimerase